MFLSVLHALIFIPTVVLNYALFNKIKKRKDPFKDIGKTMTTAEFQKEI